MKIKIKSSKIAATNSQSKFCMHLKSTIVLVILDDIFKVSGEIAIQILDVLYNAWIDVVAESTVYPKTLNIQRKIQQVNLI